jgi:putative phage-type endonuclease
MKRFNDDSRILFDTVAQDSEEWLAWRNEGIGSSDVVLLMTEKPVFDRTVGTLWKQKIGYERAVAINNEHVKRGKEQEPIIRDMVNKMLKTKFEPMCTMRTDAPYLRASLDGWDEELDVLLEIKAPSTNVFNKYLKEWTIPYNYYCQMQYQMLVTNVEYGIFAFYNDAYPHPFIIPVENNHELQLDIERRCALFWKSVETKTPIGWDGMTLKLFPARPTMFIVVADKEKFLHLTLMKFPLPVNCLLHEEEGSFIQLMDSKATSDLIALKQKNPHHEVRIINLVASPFSDKPDEVEFSSEGIMKKIQELL